MKNKIIQIKDTSKQTDRSNEVKPKSDFDLGDLFLPPVTRKIVTKDVKPKSQQALEFRHVETKNALWKVEVQTTRAKHASLECHIDKESFTFKLCLDDKRFLFNDIQNVFDFLLSKKEKENKEDNIHLPTRCELE